MVSLNISHVCEEGMRNIRQYLTFRASLRKRLLPHAMPSSTRTRTCALLHKRCVTGGGLTSTSGAREREGLCTPPCCTAGGAARREILAGASVENHEREGAKILMKKGQQDSLSEGRTVSGHSL